MVIHWPKLLVEVVVVLGVVCFGYLLWNAREHAAPPPVPVVQPAAAPYIPEAPRRVVHVFKPKSKPIAVKPAKPRVSLDIRPAPARKDIHQQGTKKIDCGEVPAIARTSDPAAVRAGARAAGLTDAEIDNLMTCLK